MENTRKRINAAGCRFHNPGFLSLVVAVLFTNLLCAQLLHESGHWAVLSLTGRAPVWSLTGLVQLWDQAPVSSEQWVVMVNPDGETGWLRLNSLPSSNAEWVLFLAAGPLAQILAIAVGLAIAMRARGLISRTFGLMVAQINAFGHFFYQVVSGLRGGGGDETLLGYYLGIPWPIIASFFGAAALLGLVVSFALLPSARIRLKWGAALFLGTLPIGPLLMVANRQIVVNVAANNPWFRPVFGFSLPVLVLGAISLCAILLTIRPWKAAAIETEQPAAYV